jgi:hypothetical protein
MILIIEAHETRIIKEVEVVIRKIEDVRDHEHNIVHIVVGVVEEKSKEREAEKDGTEPEATKEEILAKLEKVADIIAEVVVKIEIGINIHEVEAEAKKESLYCFKLVSKFIDLIM